MNVFYFRFLFIVWIKKKEAQKELMEDAASEELREKQESSTEIHGKESET